VTTAALIDYGAGNLVSIGQALELLGAEVRVCRRADDLAGADVIVVPGVGASGPAMMRLRRQGLDRAIPAAVEAGAWYLGICLGLQLLFERSEEDGARMLGLMAGNVAPIPDAPRLPHIGWNGLEPVGEHPLLAGIAPGTPAYFVHSYVAAPRNHDFVVAETVHGGRFASAIAQDRLLGVQFHPERSGADGLRILANALALVEGRRPAAATRALSGVI
jgi:imidazole glycerol-phosphate synthase subunit HisH